MNKREVKKNLERSPPFRGVARKVYRNRSRAWLKIIKRDAQNILATSLLTFIQFFKQNFRFGSKKYNIFSLLILKYFFYLLGFEPGILNFSHYFFNHFFNVVELILQNFIMNSKTINFKILFII
jgi:hypothetical protein